MIIPEDNLEMNKGDPGKTWDLINELTSRKCGKNQNISAIAPMHDYVRRVNFTNKPRL